jgi:hypothetical protein
MVALCFEVYGAFCVFSLIAFIVWAAVAKLRPDLEEEEFDLAELEKLKKLVSSEEPGGAALSIDSPIIEKPSCPPPARPAKQSERSIRRRPHLFHIRKPRTTW